MNEGNASVNLVAAVDQLREIRLMTDLGVPASDLVTTPGGCDEALTWLHLAAACLRFSVIADLADFYCARTGFALQDLGYGAEVMRMGGAVGARDRAAQYYAASRQLNPTLAEANYGLGRVAQLGLGTDGDIEEPLAHFRRCLDLPAHEATPAHAHLHANAHWESAWLLERAGRVDEALTEYRQALSRLDTFGVHHVRVARFYRRLGLQADAAEQYLVCARYTHRYFPEFVLPPLQAAPATAAAPVPDEIFTTPAGARVYFHKGQYILVPRELGTPDVHALDDLLQPRTEAADHSGLARWLDSLTRFFRPRRSNLQVRCAQTIADFVPERV